MLLSNIISNNTSVIHLVESESDHGTSMEDTLEAEISKLEITINDLEADNDLPDIDICASDLEEGEILDSFLNEAKQSETSTTLTRNLVIDNDGSNNDKCVTCDILDNIDEGILDSEEKSQNIECNNGDRHTVTSDHVPNTIVWTVNHENNSKPNSVIHLRNSSEPTTLEIKDSTHSPEPETQSPQNRSEQNQKTKGRHEIAIPVKLELKMSNENKFNSSMSVIISNDCEKVSLQRCDSELSTNDITVHLNSINRSNMASTYTPQHGTYKRNEASSHKNSDSSAARSSLHVNVDDDDDVVHESSHESLQLHASEFEDALLYGEDDDDDVPFTFARIKDNESVVSSTPLKIEAGTLKRWKPTFLSPNTQTFLILDEFGDFSDQEQSVYSCLNSPIQNKPVQKAGATHSTQHANLSCNSLSFKENEDRIISDEAGGSKSFVQLSDEASDGLKASSIFAGQSPVLANASLIQGCGIQDIFVPVTEDTNMDIINLDTSNFESLTDQVSPDTETVTRLVTVYGGDTSNSIPEVNALVSNFPSKCMNQNCLEQKQNINSRHNGDYISNNPQENLDNNNPEWELLRKLETDEERYRAVRQRWRNLIIPDPNQDLTCRNWRIQRNISKVKACVASTNSDAVIDETYASRSDAPGSMQGHHKRSLSDEQASMSQPVVKRSRTQSCTAVFDVRLEQLRRNIHYEKQQIYNEEQLALKQLDMKQIMQRYHLQSHYHAHGIDGQMLQLFHQQRGDMERVQQEYDDARLAVERANFSQVQILEKACEEVRAFHKFYQGLDHNSDAGNAMFLSESQLEELWETEDLYDQYGRFYSASETHN